MSGLRDHELLLLPTPRSVDVLGGAITLPDVISYEGMPEDMARATLGPLARRAVGGNAILKVSFDAPMDVPRAPLAEQRYALRIAEPEAPGGPLIRIASPSLSGARYALYTLAQILRRYGREVPQMLVRDEPSFAARGVMLDISRDRVPTMQHLLETVDLLASLKINHLQLYTEHTFAYPGHEVVWGGWSPMTGEEVKRLDGHCRARGIELAANQNCFGHLTQWFKHEQYRHYAEITDPQGKWMFDAWPRQGPWSLCPTDPRVPPFVEGLLQQLLPHFSAPLVNIGCDEVYDIAYGRSKNEVARKGRAAVYFEFVKKVCKMARTLKKRPMFWADILNTHPDAIKEIPEDLISLVWGYEPDFDFRGIVHRLTIGQREAWVCPGTSSWLAFFGRTAERRGNIAAAAEQGAAAGAPGFLTCDWGDKGHHQQWPTALMGIANGAHAAWNATAAREFDARAASMHVLRDPTLAAGPWIEQMGDVDLGLREVSLGLSRVGEEGRLRNQSALHADMRQPLRDARQVGDVKLWRDAANALAAARIPAGLSPLLADQLQLALDGARFAATRALARRYPAGISPAGRKVLSEQLKRVMGEHKRLWSVDTRPGGLTHSLGEYEKMLKELEGS